MIAGGVAHASVDRVVSMRLQMLTGGGVTRWRHVRSERLPASVYMASRAPRTVMWPGGLLREWLALRSAMSGLAVPACSGSLLETLPRRYKRPRADAEPEHALGRQLYALRRCNSTNMIVYTGSALTALEGRLLRF